MERKNIKTLKIGKEWKKKDRKSQTVYTYMDGSEIDVNDGNTYIQIQPKSRNLAIE